MAIISTIYLSAYGHTKLQADAVARVPRAGPGLIRES